MWHSTRDSAWPGPGRLPSNGPPGTEHLLLSTLPIHRVRDTTFSIGTQVSFASVLLVRLYLARAGGWGAELPKQAEEVDQFFYC